MATAGMRSRTTAAQKRAGVVATALLLVFVTLATTAPANAIDYYAAGSASKGPAVVRWGIGVEWYRMEFSNAWSWSAGNSSTSKITRVRGTTTTSVGSPTIQTQGAMGPVDANRNPISQSTQFGSAMTTYSFMQSRSCLIKGLSFICGPWSWHRGHATLHSGGTWSPVGDY